MTVGYWTNRLAELRALDSVQIGQNGQNPPAKPPDATFGQFGQIVQCPERPEPGLRRRDGFEGSVSFVSSSGQVFPKISDPAEAAERASSIPGGYTKAELEASRRDAERLGYGRGRTVH
jgi:hypothetical protein